MIEQYLLDYGAIGILASVCLSMTWYFIRRDEKNSQKLTEVIKNNTIVMTKVHEGMQFCKHNPVSL